MAAKPAPRKAAKPPTLQQQLARLQKQVGRDVQKALGKAERDLKKEQRKLARAVKAGERKLVRQERALAKKVKAAVDAAERRAEAEQRKLKQMWAARGKAPAKPRRRRA